MVGRREGAAAGLLALLLAGAGAGGEPPPADLGGDPPGPRAEAVEWRLGSRPESRPLDIVGAPAGEPLAGPLLAARTHEVASLLRCVVCQGLSVADSPAPMALHMKEQVWDLLAQGYTGEQVLAYFEHSYGEFVLLRPPLRGVNWIVWSAPLVALLAGVLIVGRALRRLRRPAAAAGAVATAAPRRGGTGSPPPEPDPALDPYLDRVRELAYGPGAAAPSGIGAPRGESS